LTENANGVKLTEHNNKKGCQTMENKDAVKAYQAKMDAFKIRPSKAEGQKIRDYAAAHGMSVQGLFLEAVREYMAKDDELED